MKINLQTKIINLQAMSTIKLHRRSELFNLLRNYEFYIDGVKVGTIANGEAKKLSISD